MCELRYNDRYIDCGSNLLHCAHAYSWRFSNVAVSHTLPDGSPDSPVLTSHLGGDGPPTASWRGHPNFFQSARDKGRPPLSLRKGMPPMVDLTPSQKKQLATYKNRLASVKRGEVWASDHPGQYTPEEKAAEIARLKARIAELEALLPPWSCE